MTNKERWAGWIEAKVDMETKYLGKASKAEGVNGFLLRPCVQVVEKYPIVPDANGKPMVMPIKTLVTIGMFETDQIPQTVWATAVTDLCDATEEQLQPYTDAYDQMLQQLERNKEARRCQKAAITIPSDNDIARLAKGGVGAH
jgi:hypothetical protein